MVVVFTRENRGGSAQHATRATPTRSSHGPMSLALCHPYRQRRGGVHLQEVVVFGIRSTFDHDSPPSLPDTLALPVHVYRGLRQPYCGTVGRDSWCVVSLLSVADTRPYLLLYMLLYATLKLNSFLSPSYYKRLRAVSQPSLSTVSHESFQLLFIIHQDSDTPPPVPTILSVIPSSLWSRTSPAHSRRGDDYRATQQKLQPHSWLSYKTSIPSHHDRQHLLPKRTAHHRVRCC